VPDRIDVALHEVAAESVDGADRPLKVHSVAGPEAPERRAAQGLAHRVGDDVRLDFAPVR
jgi:hypothetical protein